MGFLSEHISNFNREFDTLISDVVSYASSVDPEEDGFVSEVQERMKTADDLERVAKMFKVFANTIMYQLDMLSTRNCDTSTVEGAKKYYARMELINREKTLINVCGLGDQVDTLIKKCMALPDEYTFKPACILINTYIDEPYTSLSKTMDQVEALVGENSDS